MNPQAAFRICLGALALFCAIGLARAVTIVPLHVPLDPNEGWNAYNSLHAMTGSVLYPAAESLLTNNYPPLSFYVVGAFGWLTGDDIVAGRIVSLISLLVVMWAIFASARRMKAGAESAMFAALVFVAGLLVFTDYVGMDDPQMLGHAIGLCGLILLLPEPKTTTNSVFAALLMTLACFIKHNLVALPLATTVWLLLQDRRSATRFALSVIAFGVAGLCLFRIAYGIPLWSVLASPRTYSLAQLIIALQGWQLWAIVPLAGFAAFFLKNRNDRPVLFCGCYIAVSVLIAIAFAGGAGVDMNIWFDAMIALSLGTALILTNMQGWRRPLAALAFALPLIAGIASSWDDAWLERDFWLRPMRDETTMAEGDVAFLRAHNGPALCEMLSLCYWAGKPAEADVFNLGQAYMTQRRSDDALVERLEAHRYAAIEFDSLDDFALTPRVKRTLLSTYRIDHTNDEGVFLVPR